MTHRTQPNRPYPLPQGCREAERDTWQAFLDTLSLAEIVELDRLIHVAKVPS